MDSVDSAAVAVVVPVVPVPVPHEPELPALAPPVLVQVLQGLPGLALAQVPLEALLRHLLSLLLPQVVGESEVHLRLQGRQWF